MILQWIPDIYNNISIVLNLLSFLVREFGRWKVKNMALESKEFPNLTLAPEFVRTIRQLGRRPSAAQITENLIKKYGTHILLSAVLGGEFSEFTAMSDAETSGFYVWNGLDAFLDALNTVQQTFLGIQTITDNMTNYV